MRAPPSSVTSTYCNYTFKQAMEVKKTNWSHKKLRRDKSSSHIYLCPTNVVLIKTKVGSLTLSRFTCLNYTIHT
jgi:hypothetical protein